MENCVDTLIFGQVCDTCDGGLILKMVSATMKFLTAGIALLAVVGIIWCGVMILTARDNASQLAKGKSRLVDIFIGIIIYGFMFVILEFLIPGGIVESTTDSSTTSCPVVEALPPPTTTDGGNPPGGSEDPPGGSENPPAASGKYPWATVTGKASGGFIQCPRNSNYKYYGSGSKSVKDELFQSVAHSCPFTTVVYPDGADDEACAQGGTMHWVSSKGWCLVNSKIDVLEYDTYLLNNYIKQDGKTCTTSGNCKTGVNKPRDQMLSTHNVCDWGACNYFANTHMSNLNNGEVVSNDAYAGMFGRNWFDGWNHITNYGTSETKTTWNGRSFYEYNDGLAGEKPAGNQGGAPGGIERLKDILKELRAGRAVSTAVRSGKPGGGHYLTTVGYTKSCGYENGSYKDCNQYQLVVLNTDGKMTTLGGTAGKYCLGYSNAEKACPGR